MYQTSQIVVRKSHGCDLYFKVQGINDEGAYILAGINYRLVVTADPSDLLPIETKVIKDYRELFEKEIRAKVEKILQLRKERDDKMAQSHGDNIFKKPGKVLHVDADKEYLKMCLSCYEKLGVPAYGAHIAEREQADQITDLLKEHMPDILVITGHDSFKATNYDDELKKYRNSKYYIDTVKKARLFQPSKDGLVIFAGACQSHFEGLIEAGANVASSPERVIIHAYDPVLVAEQLSYASADTLLGIEEIIVNCITGLKGLGGVQTRGTFRYGLPKPKPSAVGTTS